MDLHKMTRFFMLCVLKLLICLKTIQAFKCQSCSYAYSKDDPNADTACINLPAVYTGWQVLDCENYCIVQETYNKVLHKVVAYWRSCTHKPDTGYCIGDQLVTCFHTCQGDLCNSWVRGQLHELYGSNGATTTTMAMMTYATILNAFSLAAVALFSISYR